MPTCLLLVDPIDRLDCRHKDELGHTPPSPSYYLSISTSKSKMAATAAPTTTGGGGQEQEEDGLAYVKGALESGLIVYVCTCVHFGVGLSTPCPIYLLPPNNTRASGREGHVGIGMPGNSQGHRAESRRKGDPPVLGAV